MPIFEKCCVNDYEYTFKIDQTERCHLKIIGEHILLEHEKEQFILYFGTVNCIFTYSNCIFSQDAILCFVENYFFSELPTSPLVYLKWNERILICRNFDLKFLKAPINAIGI